MTPQAGQLHHVEIYVSDLAKSRVFWDWFLGELGYALYQEWPQGCSLKFGETYLVLVQTEAEFLADGYHRKRTGLNHLAFHAKDRAQVDWFAQEFVKRGHPLLYPDQYPPPADSDYYAVFCEDPDRIKVELVAD